MSRRREIKIIVLLAAGLALAAGFMLDRRSTASAYLVAWVTAAAIPIGALALWATSYLVRRVWTEALHEQFVATAATLPVIAVASLPILFFTKQLYPAAADPSALPPFKSYYLATWFFILRGGIYFGLWIGLTVRLRRAWRNDGAMVRAASAGLVVYALTVSLAGIDWMESLEPDFHSSVYGLLFLSFTLLSGFAFVLGVSLLPGRRIGRSAGYSGLLLSLILLWGYLHAMQYIVIWSGNIPDEVTWYQARSEQGWQYLLAVLSLGQFVLPFFALLSAKVRFGPRALLMLCGLTLLMRCCEAALLILPAIHHIALLTTALMLLAAVLFFGSLLWLAFDRALANDGRLFSLAWGMRHSAGSEAPPAR
ncbi:hypothetical protein [Bradyrhizobium sp. CCBAU 53421]|uniref:hypothetical protein n=1 Tax=Bradyrhizobium sp. CCBAU 53421 TaxID=1325120 RepID=UPI00188C37B9|nr:hypothetical protein [Bradyrhizobium sp. CCBAU 53421]QOZ32885.1 hypothetical protein XH92_15385 [Bradyrhizobium sp. CCBAU 53421]